VNALRRIHAALRPGGLVVDSQPISPEPRVEAAGGNLGRLDMREWRATIDAVDERMAEAIDQGVFAVESEHTITVPDQFDPCTLRSAVALDRDARKCQLTVSVDLPS
jgi:hypothetical protein